MMMVLVRDSSSCNQADTRADTPVCVMNSEK